MTARQNGAGGVTGDYARLIPYGRMPLQLPRDFAAGCSYPLHDDHLRWQTLGGANVAGCGRGNRRMALRGLAGAAGLVLALVASACSTTSRSTVDAAATSSPAIEEAAAAEALATSDAADYRIGPMDILDITVFQVPDLSKEVQVSQGGHFTLPLIGDITAAGKTAAQLQSEIAAKLGSKYLQSPQVTVFVKDMQSQRVTVEGQVVKPGIYPTTGQTTLLQAIALSGGLTDLADTRAIVVLRTADGQRQAAKFDYASILGGRADDPAVQAGDVIVVDQSGLKTTWHELVKAVPVFGLFTPLL
jgi:polysaccharide biosynthesis/export protein